MSEVLARHRHRSKRQMHLERVAVVSRPTRRDVEVHPQKRFGVAGSGDAQRAEGPQPQREHQPFRPDLDGPEVRRPVPDVRLVLVEEEHINVRRSKTFVEQTVSVFRIEFPLVGAIGFGHTARMQTVRFGVFSGQGVKDSVFVGDVDDDVDVVIPRNASVMT